MLCRTVGLPELQVLAHAGAVRDRDLRGCRDDLLEKRRPLPIIRIEIRQNGDRVLARRHVWKRVPAVRGGTTRQQPPAGLPERPIGWKGDPGARRWDQPARRGGPEDSTPRGPWPQAPVE